MPHLVEFQCFHWGSLPAHPVPLTPERVTALVGSNGANKTTFLDGIKLLFGLTRYPGGTAREDRTAEGYIYRPGDDAEAEPAEYALVKGVFDNAPRVSGERPFAGATPEGLEVDHVTVVAQVLPRVVRWMLLDGHRTWGADGRDLSADIQNLLSARRERWLKRSSFSRVMQDAGVSSALLQVLSLGQGQASAALEGDERAVLRHVVQMLGQQQALDGFVAAVAEHRGVRADLEREQEQLEQAAGEVESLEQLVEVHNRWTQVTKHFAGLTLELPFSLLTEQRRRTALLAAAVTGLEQLEQELPQLAARQRLEINQQQESRQRRTVLVDERTNAIAATALAQQSETNARLALEASSEATPELARSARAEQQERVAAHARLAETIREHRQELRALKIGALRRPPVVAKLVDRLASARVLSEHLQIDDASAGDLEAQLGDAIWAVSVPADEWTRAVEIAAEIAADCPVVRADSGDEPFRSFLKEVAVLPPGVAMDQGVLSGASFIWRRAHQPTRLGEAGRLKRRGQLEELLATDIERLDALAGVVERMTEEAAALEAAVAAKSMLPELEALTSAAQARVHTLESEESALVRRLETLSASLSMVSARLREIESERKEHQARAAAERRTLKDLANELERCGSYGERPEQVRPLAQVRSELQSCDAALMTFPDAVKNESLPDQLERQRARVAEITELVGGSVERVDTLNDQVMDARRRFNAGVRQMVPRLDEQFRQLCQETGMTGRINLVELEDDEFGLDVKVRPTHGSHTLGLRSAHLSGGQQAKAALIVLLACMSLEGGTDFLLSDEPGAHLDARNLREVGLAMRKLADRVQIIISVPTDAEAEKLDWAGHQIGFRAPDARHADHPFSSLVVMSRTPSLAESLPARSFNER